MMDRTNANIMCSLKRMPAWTDRIMYTTHTDSPETPRLSTITNTLYTSIPSYASSDHVRPFLYFSPTIVLFRNQTGLTPHILQQKPVVAVVLLPPPPPSSPSTPSPSQTIPLLRLPPSYKPRPDPYANLKKYTGRTLDRIIGYAWWLLTLIASGPGIIGMLGFGIWGWVRWRSGYVRLDETDLDGV